jgi:hypothetical protein
VGKEKVTLGEIYSNIMAEHAYYAARPTETGWKNSIRHNLTMGKGFAKVARAEGESGKGVYYAGAFSGTTCTSKYRPHPSYRNAVCPSLNRSSAQDRRVLDD